MAKIIERAILSFVNMYKCKVNGELGLLDTQIFTKNTIQRKPTPYNYLNMLGLVDISSIIG